MSWLSWTGIAIGIYLALGILMAIMLSQTPYSENGAIIITLLWPLFLFGILIGGG